MTLGFVSPLVVSYFAYGYFQNMKEYLELLQGLVLRIVPTCGNPL